MPATDNNTQMTNDEGSAQKTNRGAKSKAQLQSLAVEERVEEIVREYAQLSKIAPAEKELAVIREKAKVWEIWARLRRAYSSEASTT